MRKLFGYYFVFLFHMACFCTMAVAGTLPIHTDKSVLIFKENGKEVNQIKLSAMKANYLKINDKSLNFEDRKIYQRPLAVLHL